MLVTNSTMSLSISNAMQSMSAKHALYMDHAMSAPVKLIARHHAHVLKCCISHLRLQYLSCVNV